LTAPPNSGDAAADAAPHPALATPAAASKTPRWPRLKSYVANYFLEQDPTFWVAITPALIAAAVLFVRSPFSNYIFDEQEALLANPYVNGRELKFLDAFKRDFWGLPPDRSIGSYRPIPNLIWRLLWHISEMPWIHHWVNVVIHALNASVLAGFAFAVTRRRGLSWLIGACFLSSAVLTEAITGVVGIADVLGGLGVVLALRALSLRMWAMPLSVFAATLLGLFSKESVIVAVPLVAVTALVTAPALHERPRRVARAMLALLATASALVAYTYLRRRWFPVTMPEEFQASLPATEPAVKRGFHAFLRWFQQPRLPQDPINNPLAAADFPHRVAGALRVYWRGLVQVFFPWTLSGDYSFPQEPAPERLVFPESVLGAVALILAPLAGIAAWFRSLFVERRERRAGTAPPLSPGLRGALLVALGLIWVPVAYFPHSNIPVLLPTVRAERFWYLPALGTAFLLGVALTALHARLRARNGAIALALIAIFLGFQALRARIHAFDYIDDLSFWNATRRAVPFSAKAHLNYSVMVGARGRLEERLVSSRRALELAPTWPMAHVYYGDTLCRLHRPDDAWPHYARGFELAPNDSNLIALGLQCLWDEKGVENHSEALLALSDKFPGSWIAYLGRDIVYNGAEHGGVEKKYRPRSYNEGPKKN